MAKQFSMQRFVDDFVIGDRRLAERSDLKFCLEPDGEYPHPLTEMLSLNVGRNRSLFIKVLSSRVITGPEHQQIQFLRSLLIYCASKERSLAVQLGDVLREIRESLNLSQSQIAEHIETSRIAVSRWESGAQVPGMGTMYRWCQILGLVCPPKAALVRVVEFSPELLRFLKEDPTRLRSLPPDKFERFAAERLDRMGYNVTLTGATNRKDGGIDLIAVPNQHRSVLS